MKKLILSSFALVAFVFASNTASAQVTTAVAVTIDATTTFAMVGDGQAISTTFTPAELLTGKDVSEAVTLHYVSNKAAFISFVATDFTGVDLANTLPSSIMSFKTKVGGDAISAPTKFDAAGTVYKLNVVKGDQDVVVSYSLNPTIQANPDTYTATVTYTITAH